MANARFFRLSVFGGYDPGSEWAQETWQFGFTSIANTDGSLPSRDAIKAPMPNCEVQPSNYVSSGGGWQRYYGFESALGNAFTATNQSAIMTALKAFWDSIKLYVAADQQMEGVKITAYQVGADGKPAVINGSTMGYLDTPAAGSSASWKMPPQCASVISLQSGARGPGGRGRSYVPCTGATLGAGGVLGSTERTALLNAMNTLGTTLAGTPKTLLVVANQFQFTYSGITTYRVGNHVDIQRRRVKSVPETYDVVNALF